MSGSGITGLELVVCRGVEEKRSSWESGSVCRESRRGKRQRESAQASVKMEAFGNVAAIAISAPVPIQVSLFVLWHLRVKTECSKLDIRTVRCSSDYPPPSSASTLGDIPESLPPIQEAPDPPCPLRRLHNLYTSPIHRLSAHPHSHSNPSLTPRPSRRCSTSTISPSASSLANVRASSGMSASTSMMSPGRGLWCGGARVWLWGGAGGLF